MAEKGGKGFPMSRKKVAFKSPAPSQETQKKKGSVPMEEDGPVQIDSDSESEGFVNSLNETLSKGNGKAPKETAKSGMKSSLDGLKTGTKTSLEAPATKGKGGKAYSSGKAGGKGGLPRASAVKPPVTEVELKLEMDIPEDARVIMDCEAATILQGIQDSLSVLSDDPSIKMPPFFNKALEYCKGRNNYTNAESVRQVLETLKEHGVTEGEICMIGNAFPETIAEVYALIPSLKANKHKIEGPIQEVLVNLAGLRRVE
ncbi:DNA-directed RNA polymerases IV and V subunit 4-like isoform X2 [Asparagus officinalis]|uniref:DNA-directed RNA polymerases IV and V subunit 4-like isoform X2 n=1 Tax=Asparagus officinalis TaxID=4686 RepID=UPI00098E51B3|nr:DNA-directed RNA polymerases IV and V subunit 4-like isoform X2 [Asparagus officinalis]